MASEIKVIVFQLQDEQYGVEVRQVQTIERLMPLTRVPRTPDFVKGVVNLRGTIMPIIDLRERFGLPAVDPTDHTRMVIVKTAEVEVGLIVDSANDVIDIKKDQLDDPPEIVGGVKAKYLQGVAKLEDDSPLVLLSLEQVLNKEEIIQLENMKD